MTPGDGARNVPVTTPLRVETDDGRLHRVRVQRTGGRDAGLPVGGRITPDGRTWRPDGPGNGLAPGGRYAVDALARDGDGRRVTRHAEFTTSGAHRLVGRFTPEDGQTVGTGMIVSVVFSRPVTDRAAVERAVQVSAEPEVPVAAHWFGRSRLDFRPRTYWSPGTRITLGLRLHGLRAAPRAWGTQRKQVHFTVGRDRRTVVDARNRTLTVLQDGAVRSRVPVTAGSGDNPTYNGTMVVSQKMRRTRMNGATVGFGDAYDIKDVPHALRLTDSGTFLHGNYWAGPGVFGRTNISHGCIGLADGKGGDPRSPAGRFFDGTLVGDVVEVRGSPERTVRASNGLSGWNMSWQRWRAGSALDR